MFRRVGGQKPKNQRTGGTSVFLDRIRATTYFRILFAGVFIVYGVSGELGDNAVMLMV